MSRIAALRKEKEARIDDYQTFCLNPSLEKFNNLCLYETTDDNFPVWRRACLYQYGEQWGFNS